MERDVDPALARRDEDLGFDFDAVGAFARDDEREDLEGTELGYEARAGAEGFVEGFDNLGKGKI